jgi:hypothetical protein
MKTPRTLAFALLFWTAALGFVAFDWVRSAAHCNASLWTLLAAPQGAERCVVSAK